MKEKLFCFKISNRNMKTKILKISDALYHFFQTEYELFLALADTNSDTVTNYC